MSDRTAHETTKAVGAWFDCVCKDGGNPNNATCKDLMTTMVIKAGQHADEERTGSEATGDMVDRFVREHRDRAQVKEASIEG